MMVVLCLILSALILYVNCELLELPYGFINGSVKKTKNDRLFLQFYGIPYAEPPVGELRLKPPVAVKPWPGVKNCSKPPPKCIQPDLFSQPENPSLGQEDCLYLNVFVPKDLFKLSGKTPVMIIIHGGGYHIGSGSELTPDYLMDRDVIFVSFNYRLGILGFFGMNNDVISGNFGMKDQVMALRWVHDNIARFGGDPDNVTLMGHSAGASSVHLHMFSPLSKGLFHKAMFQSGNGFASWSHHDVGYGEAIATTILVISGCFRVDADQTLKCLQRIPAEEFFTLEKKLRVWDDGLNVILKPMIETKVKNQPFLAQKPGKTTYVTKVPSITGITSGEGAMHVAMYLRDDAKLAKALNSNKKRALPFVNDYYSTTKIEDVDNVTQKVIDFYFGSKNISFETALKFVDMMSDSVFRYLAVKVMQMYDDRKYVYFYDHRGSSSLIDFANLKIDLGVCHADELFLLFRDEVLETKWTSQDRKVSETLVNFWTNFAIYGDPNGLAQEKIWKPVETKDIEYLHIKSESIIMEKGLLKERLEFWDSLPTGWK